MTALLGLGRWISGAREWLVLIALAIAAAYFFVDARRVRADRDAWASWGDQLCGFAGATTEAATVEVDTDKGMRKVAKARGQICSEAVRDLAHFRAASQAETARVLQAAREEQQRKSASDLAEAKANAADRRRATARMEEVDAQVGDDDHVDGNWFARLNELGGLR